ncbi:MAG: cation diffusion facilitator family transporter [Leptolyngbyaceae cyanobacterium]
MSTYHSQVQKVLIITLVLNLAVMTLKFIVGFLTGSLSLLADALHSVTDSVNNVLGLVTSNLSSPKPDRNHPYGHHKYEAIGALGIAAFLGITCFEIIQTAIGRIFASEVLVEVTGFELWLLVIVLGINIGVAFYERHVGNQLNSPILVADAHHTMSDVWITILVLLGLIGVWVWKIQWIDLLFSFPVALMVLWSGWTVVRENLPWLVDEIAIAPEAIHTIVMQVPGVLNCHDIASRGMLGRQTFIEMHLIVEAIDVETAHQITEQVEVELKKFYNPVRLSIHIEPPSYSSEHISYEDTPISQ